MLKRSGFVTNTVRDEQQTVVGRCRRNMNQKKASIIVPCYKVEQYLPRCLDSLMNQTLDEIEVICINDGSPDSCLDILKAYQARYGEKIVIIDKKNEGVWRGRFDGIKIAQGEYIGFVDSDDYVEPTFAEDLYTAAKTFDADIAVCGFSRIDMNTGKAISKEMCQPRLSFDITEEPGRLIELNGAPWNKFFRADLLKNMTDLQDPPPVLDDLVFHLLIYKDMQGKIVFVPKILVNYLVRNDSIINTIDAMKLTKGYDSFLEVKQIYLNSNPSQELLEALDTIAFLHLGISMTYRLASDPAISINDAVTKTTRFLDSYFPLWRDSHYLTLTYAFENKGAFLKLYPASLIYKAGFMKPALKLYQTMISKLNIDIKW